MKLPLLLNKLKDLQVIGDVPNKDVTGIHYDSRQVTENSIFVAVKGFTTDGHKYAAEAVSRGAIAVFVEDNKAVPDEICTGNGAAKVLCKDTRKALAELARVYYNDPSRRLKLIGITGSKGKTTTTFFIKSILEEAGHKSGLIGTIANYIGEEEIKSSLTTPEASDLNELLAKMADEGCEYAVMEVSSHSLELKRVHGLHFTSSILTNITSDHLDFHKTFEQYVKAKKILFDMASEETYCLINYDDKSADLIMKDSTGKKITYGASDDSEFQMKGISIGFEGTKIKVDFEGKTWPLETTLIGEFNAYNITAAFACAVTLGIKPDVAQEGIKRTKQVPGRFEVHKRGGKIVIVDYAHTSDSLEKSLLTVRKLAGTEQSIYTVFGCGGDRDKTKRPVMGRIASGLSDDIFITNDNPRTEDPEAIINDIIKGIKRKNYKVVISREEAIKTAILETEPDAIILIAGKGHENYHIIGTERKYFSDRETAEKYLGMLNVSEEEE